MKQVVMLVAAGLMALVLTGCEDKPKQPEVNTTTVIQPQPKGDDTKAPEVKTDTTTAPAGAQSQE